LKVLGEALLFCSYLLTRLASDSLIFFIFWWFSRKLQSFSACSSLSRSSAEISSSYYSPYFNDVALNISISNFGEDISFILLWSVTECGPRFGDPTTDSLLRIWLISLFFFGLSTFIRLAKFNTY
jgi:hypothetical protein